MGACTANAKLSRERRIEGRQATISRQGWRGEKGVLAFATSRKATHGNGCKVSPGEAVSSDATQSSIGSVFRVIGTSEGSSRGKGNEDRRMGSSPSMLDDRGRKGKRRSGEAARYARKWMKESGGGIRENLFCCSYDKAAEKSGPNSSDRRNARGRWRERKKERERERERRV